MSTNPLFRANNSPTQTTRPTKAVNQTGVSISRTHNTFDNSFFNFKTQRFAQYEPFWWKNCVAGDNEPFSNSHNVRSLPFASPILSPMKLNKDYFQVPHYAIQPNTWDYIFKSPTQGDDVPADAQNLFPLFVAENSSDVLSFREIWDRFSTSISIAESESDWLSAGDAFMRLLFLEQFVSSGCLLYQLGYKINPLFEDTAGVKLTFDQVFDRVVNRCEFYFAYSLTDADSPTGSQRVVFCTSPSTFEVLPDDVVVVDKFTAVSLLRNVPGTLTTLEIVTDGSCYEFMDYRSSNWPTIAMSEGDSAFSAVDESINCIRMDVVIAYQLACAQYYVNPRVDFLYNSQLYRDNWISSLRPLSPPENPFQLATFEYNGIPVLYDYFSLRYFKKFAQSAFHTLYRDVDDSSDLYYIYQLTHYLFGFREQLRFGDYLVDSRTQALGYGEPGSDVVDVMDDSVTITDISQKLVLNRYRSAVAHLDNSSEDYLKSMFGEELPPDYHYPKFIVHSEFGVNGEEVSNTTSDDQGNYVTNLKSGDDSSAFEIKISVPSILIGISYVSLPRVYCQTKERHYFHADRYDMFQPMLQYFGDQEIYNREVNDSFSNPADAYAYVSRNGEYKQRLSQCSGAFLTSLRSWLFVADPLVGEGKQVLPIYQQSSLAIRAHDFEFNRFLRAVPGYALGTGFHFIMQYNNKNVDNRPMEVNPLPLYPNNSL